MKKKSELRWQRGYRCHTLWRKDERLGRVSLAPGPDDSPVYVCEVGTLRGETGKLAEAKRWVLRQARLNEVQLALF